MGNKFKRGRRFRVAGLFAGIGGIELGLEKAGHQTVLLCENDPGCERVLTDRLRHLGAELHGDINNMVKLPEGIDLVAAGFPCQDLSQAGMTKGIAGSRSGLVGKVFELLEHRPVPWVLLENVPFMLQLGRGRAVRVIVDELERLGYDWAYRVVDTLGFGLPQRRRRVYLVASNDGDPRTVLFADETIPKSSKAHHDSVACGFYWTEGIRGLGWAVNALPTLKGGSAVGIPSPPAVLLPNGRVCKPDIRDAERLQGFEPDWTAPAGKIGARWKLVGNAVSVPVAAWLGGHLANPGAVHPFVVEKLTRGNPWPTAAWSIQGERLRVHASEWPIDTSSVNLLDFLEYPMPLLSAKATSGFLSRTEISRLRFPDGFLERVRAHKLHMDKSAIPHSFIDPTSMTSSPTRSGCWSPC